MLFSKASMLLAVIVTAVYAAPAPLGVTRLDTFRKRDVASTLATQLSPGSTIVFPQDNSWENVTERWTLYQAPSFQVAVEPATEQDVVATVNIKKSELSSSTNKIFVGQLCCISQHQLSGPGRSSRLCSRATDHPKWCFDQLGAT